MCGENRKNCPSKAICNMVQVKIFQEALSLSEVNLKSSMQSCYIKSSKIVQKELELAVTSKCYYNSLI